MSDHVYCDGWEKTAEPFEVDDNVYQAFIGVYVTQRQLVRNESRIFKVNWVIVTGPQSSLSERAIAHQSIIMKRKDWVTHRVPEDETLKRQTAYLQALEPQSGWVIMVNWKQALWTISSCKRRRNAITVKLLHPSTDICNQNQHQKSALWLQNIYIDRFIRNILYRVRLRNEYWV